MRIANIAATTGVLTTSALVGLVGGHLVQLATHTDAHNFVKVAASTSAASTNSNSNGNGTGNGSSASNGNSQHYFTLQGSMTGLTPGRANQVVPVTVTNPGKTNSTITVQQISATVTSSDPSRCSAQWVTVTPYNAPASSPLALQGGQSAVVQLPISFTDSKTVDQSGCAGFTYNVTYSGTGTGNG